MTSPTKPVAWVSAAELERVSEFGFVHAEITQRSRTDKVPLYTAAQLRAARLEGVKAGIEAARKVARDFETMNRKELFYKYGVINDAESAIHTLDPETVLKEEGK